MPDPIIVCILGNKCDKQSEREVGYEVAREFANSIGADFYETSAFNGSGTVQ